MSETTPARPGRVAVISDAHLSWWRRWQDRLDRFSRLWAGADTAVFNGDTLDRTTAGRPERARELVEHIRRRCGADGVTAIFLAGNTDLDAVETDHLELAGGAVVVTHGHVVFPAMCPWRSKARSLAKAREQALAEMPPAQRGTLAGQLSAARMGLSRHRQPLDTLRPERWLLATRLWTLMRRPDRVLSVLRAWRKAPRVAAEFFSRYRPETRAIIMGHTHRPGVWQMGERWVINTGSPCGPGRPLSVRVEGRAVVVRRTKPDGGRLRLDRKVAEVFV